MFVCRDAEYSRKDLQRGFCQKRGSAPKLSKSDRAGKNVTKNSHRTNLETAIGIATI